MVVRKNFTMSEYVVQNLKFLADTMHKKQSQVIQDLITDKMKEYEKESKLQTLQKMSGMFTGQIGEDVSIQSIKADSEN